MFMLLMVVVMKLRGDFDDANNYVNDRWFVNNGEL